MNIRDLEYVRAVVRQGHFGRAAKSCHVSQPALSSQIKKLEAELGVTLFERDNRSVRLTRVGEQLAPLVNEALSIIEAIRVSAEASRDPLSGALALGSIPTIAPYLLPHFIQEMGQALPSIKLKFEEDITERLETALISGHLDAAILATPPDHPKLDAIRLYDEPFWLVLPEGHDLADGARVHISGLPIDELLLLSEGHCFRDQAMDICQIQGPEMEHGIRATNLQTLVNLVAAGQGITLVPELAITALERSGPGLVIRPLADPVAYRRTYLTFRKSFPRRSLMERMATLICGNVPQGVRLV